MELNEKAVTEAERRLQAVISELDDTMDDFLEKSRFVLMELVKVSTIHVDDTPDTRTRNLNRANMLANIAYDYLAQAQSAITSLVLREGKARTDRSDPKIAECRMEDEGGKADE